MGIKDRKKKSRRNYSIKSMQIITVLVVIFALVLIFALLKIQVFNHEDIAKAASSQYYSNKIETPRRGAIYDRNGVKLASSSFVYRIGVTPKHLYSRDDSCSKTEIIRKLADELSLDEAKLSADVSDLEASYVQIAKDVSEDVGKKLEDFVYEYSVGGIRLDKEAKRYYSNGYLASQVIGFASNEGGVLEGRLGVELAYDNILAGTAGFSYGARDNFLSRGLLPYTQSEEKAAVDGSDLHLSLDMGIQEILQDELAAACKAHDAVDDGMALVMNPYTGEVYAMASYPYFRSDDPTAAPANKEVKDWDPGDEASINWLQENAWRNKNISSLYEAGSTMKAITAAIGFEEDICGEDSWYSDDPINVEGAEISCWTGHGHGHESFEQAFWNSCNPVFVQVALSIGVNDFYNYIRDLGFYEPTGLGLPGEASCIFHNNPSILDMANLSFGESSAVTPMHLARAYAALVNGGKLITPTIIKDVKSPDGRILESPGTKVDRRVFAPETSARVRNLLSGMVVSSSNYANTWGYDMGGKTSTSTEETTGQVTVSFMAAAPIDHPEILVLMILQKPSNNKVGGPEAQVVTQDTTSKILDYMNIDRSYTDMDAYKMGKSIHTPNFIGWTLRDAAKAMTYEHVFVKAGDEKTQGDSEIAAQIPAPDTLIYPGTEIRLYSKKPETETITMPDLSQLNYNEVMDICNKMGLVPQFEGPLTGITVAQRVKNSVDLPEGSEGKVGELVNFGAVVEVALEIRN